MQVSTIDHISLQRTSVATYGYLAVRQSGNIARNSVESDALEPSLLLALNLPGDVCEQPLQHIDPLEVVDKPRILGLAFL